MISSSLIAAPLFLEALALQINLLIDFIINSFFEVFKGLVIICEIVTDIIAAGTVDRGAPDNKGVPVLSGGGRSRR